MKDISIDIALLVLIIFVGLGMFILEFKNRMIRNDMKRKERERRDFIKKFNHKF